jgi:hypothetical protein
MQRRARHPKIVGCVLASLTPVPRAEGMHFVVTRAGSSIPRVSRVRGVAGVCTRGNRELQIWVIPRRSSCCAEVRAPPALVASVPVLARPKE